MDGTDGTAADAGESTDETAGESTGETAGESTGETAGESTGDAAHPGRDGTGRGGPDGSLGSPGNSRDGPDDSRDSPGNSRDGLSEPDRTETGDDACTDPTCYCRASGVVETLGRKYAIPVLCALAAHDSLRFGELESHLPTASTSTLSDRLDELAERGLVERRQYDEIPPRVEYRLTDDGRELGALLEPLVEWAAGRE